MSATGRELTFEWDESKREATVRKHGIDFEDAMQIFGGRFVVMEATSLTEKRFRAIGPLNGIFITVVFTIRGDAHRIITARRARHGEIQTYHENYAL